MCVLTACASSRPPNTDLFDGSGETQTIRIIVQNLNFADARLYALRRGTRTSLGTVGGKQDHEFTLEWNVSEPLQIEINLMAGPKCTTEPLLADPGDLLELQIALDFSRTGVCREGASEHVGCAALQSPGPRS